jgi:hypothetical protein
LAGQAGLAEEEEKQGFTQILDWGVFGWVMPGGAKRFDPADFYA